MQRALAIIPALVFAMVSADARLPVVGGVRVSSRPTNTMIIADASGTGETNYPLQFGRPFKKGDIPSGQCPIVIYAGSQVITQTDIKNRYPDGSVEFAVIAAVLRSIPRSGANQTISFAAGPCGSGNSALNAALTEAQMLDASYNFDAQIRFKDGATVYGSSNNVQTLATWQGIHDGGFRVAVNGAVYNVTGLDFSGIGLVGYNDNDTSLNTVAGVVNARLTAMGIPAKLSYYRVINANRTISGGAGSTIVNLWLLRTTGFTGASGETITALSAPAGGAIDISAMLGMSTTAHANVVSPARTQAASARAMLANGNYTRWTSGPVAQTVVIADDSANRAYDIGFGDATCGGGGTTPCRPIRPRFYATFWPATHQVSVNAVAECCLTTELTDSRYKFTVTAGNTWPTTVYNGDLSATVYDSMFGGYKQHWGATSWNKRFWIGGTPQQRVNINNNIGWLVSTSFIPHYDPTIDVSAAVAEYYSNRWLLLRNDIYDHDGHGSIIFAGQGNGGRNGDIGLLTQLEALWLYSGDWRARVMGSNEADLAGNFPIHLREGAPGKRLLRSDTVGSSTGLGYPIALADHATFYYGPEMGSYSCCQYDYIFAKDTVTRIGMMNNSEPHSIEVGHSPSYVFVPYILTGDPWYLQEQYFWADIFIYQTGISGDINSRGPTFAEGAMADGSGRGPYGGMRARVEAALAAPDGDPIKTYFIETTNDAIAAFEGEFGITGTPFDGNVEKTWAARFGRPVFSSAPPDNPSAGPISPLHLFTTEMSSWLPTNINAEPTIPQGVTGGWFQSGGPTGNGLATRATCNGCSVTGTILTIPRGGWTPDPTWGCLPNGVSGINLGLEVQGIGPANVPNIITGCNGKITGNQCMPASGGLGTSSSTECTIAYSVQNRSGNFPITEGSGVIGGFTSPWIEAYYSMAWSRASQYGFAIEPLRQFLIPAVLNLINNSSDPKLISAFWLPTASRTAWLTSWTQVPSLNTPSWLTNKPRFAFGATIDDYFSSQLFDDGRPIYFAPALSYSREKADPGAAAAWNWYYNNVYSKIPASDFGGSTMDTGGPKWATVPCDYCQILPAMPTKTYAGSGPAS